MKEPITKILVVVDMQNDFLMEDGKLFIGHNTDEFRKRVADFAYDFNGYVIFTRDVHIQGSCEFGDGPGQFPEHCVMDTPGAGLVEEIKWKFNYSLIWKESFSSLGVVDEVLKGYRAGSTEIHVVGVCTHICVHDIVSGIVNRVKNFYKEIPKIIIHQDMVDDFDDAMANFAIKRMIQLYGVEVRVGYFSKRSV